MKHAVLFEKLNNKNVRCLACSWYCKIPPDNVGICGTRLNKKGVLYSLVYGKAIGLHLDPAEKKPLYHFLPGTQILSFGTVGCNFGCLFCQNWEMSQINKTQIKDKKIIELIDQMSVSITPREIVEMALNLNARGIAYTYNEPAIFTEFTHDTAKIAREKNLKNIYVSNGFESGETFNYIKDYIDAINIDLKSFNGDFYRKICKAKIGPVLENIKRFFRAGIETEITTLVIPHLNDSNTELENIAQFLAGISTDIPWHISAFHPSYKMQDIPVTSHDTLINAYEIGKTAGLKYVYIGNIIDCDRSSTHCPRCKSLLIKRLEYNIDIKDIDLSKGICTNCKEKIYGIWK